MDASVYRLPVLFFGLHPGLGNCHTADCVNSHTAALSRSRLGHWGRIGQQWYNVDSDSIHVCTFKKRNKTKEENSRLHSQLSLSSSWSLLIMLFYMFGWPQPFQSHMEDKSLRCSSLLLPRALSIFSIIFILMGIPSGSLCGGKRWCSKCWAKG